MNRLAQESSPYLRQHQHNPVDWYPWGEEAFALARSTGRPILLSVGYSACHWCHVMERESFEDPATAALMNRLFVNVKVDREERPDVDNIYQTAVQVLRRSGGWPLTVFCTPEGKPFFAGTYFPPEARHGLPAFRQVLEQIDAAWRDRRAEVDGAVASITDALSRVRATGPADDVPGAEVLARGAEFLLTRIDTERGGFEGAPKFPSPTNLWALWRHGVRSGDPDYRDAVLLTLAKMGEGGIYDQLGGGFHRYSTDADWLVPHFEKMLYDNAQLVSLYAEAARTCAADPALAADAPQFARIVTETLEYLEREMCSPEGLFYAATDADSEGEEGRFFVWSPAQVRSALAGEPDGAALADAVCAYWDVTPQGNWEGHSILRRLRSEGEVAATLGIDRAVLRERMTRARPHLYAARAARVPPLRDDKALVSWNALTIVAFVDGWRLTGREGWRAVARRAADTLLDTLVVDGRLLHSVCAGDRRGPAFLDDHAALGLALLHVYEATGGARYRDAALALAMALEAHFGDGDGWFQTPDDGEALIVRPRDAHDSAVPSGAGLAAQFLLRLGAVTGEERWTERAVATLRAHAGLLGTNPYGSGSLLAALDTHLAGWEEVVLAGAGPERAAMERLAGSLPGLDRLVLDLATLPAGHPAAGGRSATEPTAWVCRGHTCSLPARSVRELGERLGTD